MEIHYGIETLDPFDSSVITVGSFDGLHLGHRAILDRVAMRSDEEMIPSVLITFDPHPKMVLADKNVEILTDLNEKIELLEQTNLDHLVVLPFTSDLAEMSAEIFFQEIVWAFFHPLVWILGYDHRFGKDRTGNEKWLQSSATDFCCNTETIEVVKLDEKIISSTAIRKALNNGQIALANQMFGRNYSFRGTVEKGEGIGAKLGFPTANLDISLEEKLIPSGVYVVRVHGKGQKFDGMMNVGFRPTFQSEYRTVEVHILDLDSDLVGEELEIEILEFIREERKFSSKTGLIEQLKQDIDIVKNNKNRR